MGFVSEDSRILQLGAQMWGEEVAHGAGGQEDRRPEFGGEMVKMRRRRKKRKSVLLGGLGSSYSWTCGKELCL